MATPQAIAFDVMETMVALEPQAKRLKEIGVTTTPLEAVFVQALRDGIALAASGSFEPFAEVLRGCVLSALATEQKAPQPSYDDSAIAEFLTGFGTLPAHADVEPALRLLADRGIPALFVTNGSWQTTEKIVQTNVLTALVRHIVSIDDVQAWKPLPAIYRHAAKVAGVAPESLCMIAAHPWDCHGAKSAGLSAAFVRRKHPYYPPTMTLPDAEADDLLSLVQAIIG
jgi:2-haloacid dehalogenase